MCLHVSKLLTNPRALVRNTKSKRSRRFLQNSHHVHICSIYAEKKCGEGCYSGHIWVQARVQYLSCLLLGLLYDFFIIFFFCTHQTPCFSSFLPTCEIAHIQRARRSRRCFFGLALTFPVVSPHLSSPVDAFCQTLVDTLEGTPGLRYIWSSFKPLLQGKVLYAPDTPAARLLVKEVGLEEKHIYVYADFLWTWKRSALPSFTPIPLCLN